MPKKNDSPKLQFAGIATPNTTQCPDIYFDQVFPLLKEAELKALLYIVRRTFGFKKNRDPISFNQFLRGITTRDGRTLDLGCGIRDRTTLSRALKALEAMGVIVSDKGIDERGENVTTIYSLRFKETVEGVVGNSYHPGMNRPPPVVGNSYPQHTVEQHTVRQHTVDSKGFERQTLDIKRDDFAFSKKNNFEIFENDDERLRSRSNPNAPNRGGGFTAVGEVVKTRKKRPPQSASEGPGAAATPPTGYRANSSEKEPPGRSRTGGRRSLADQAPPAIAALIEQFSDEFHDEDHVPSNISQAVRLWQASGQEATTFATAMYEARARTQKAPDVQKRAGGEAGKWGMRNKMPYYFACLRDVLGMKPPPDSS